MKLGYVILAVIYLLFAAKHGGEDSAILYLASATVYFLMSDIVKIGIKFD